MAAGARPREATVAILLMLLAGAAGLALGLYFVIWGGNFFGGLLILALGATYVLGGRALRRGQSWGWGAGLFAGGVLLILGVFLLPLAAPTMALAVGVIVLLFRTREYYGMVRADPEEEDRRREELRAQRMANPERLHCPHCGSTQLWIAADGSAFCETCETGTISVKPVE